MEHHRYYLFGQNNPGGKYFGPKYVIIEAGDKDEANYIAVEWTAIYFDGVSSGLDCECCGDRWEKIYKEELGYDNLSDTLSWFGGNPDSSYLVLLRQEYKNENGDEVYDMVKRWITIFIPRNGLDYNDYCKMRNTYALLFDKINPLDLARTLDDSTLLRYDVKNIISQHTDTFKFVMNQIGRAHV